MRQILAALILCFSAPYAFAGMDMYLYNQCLNNGGDRNMCFNNAQTLDSPQAQQAPIQSPMTAFMQGYYGAQRRQAEQQAMQLDNQRRQLEIQRMQLENERMRQELNSSQASTGESSLGADAGAGSPIPENAEPDKYATQGWSCKAGFKQVERYCVTPR